MQFWRRFFMQHVKGLALRFILALVLVSITLVQINAAEKPSTVDLGLDKEYFSSQKVVWVRDAVGKGRSKEIAIQNAKIDAHRKALERSISSFRHMIVETKDFVVTNEQLI